jgi:hypothetical protein
LCSNRKPAQRRAGEQESRRAGERREERGERREERGEQERGERRAGEQERGEQERGEQERGEQERGERRAGERRAGERRAGEQESRNAPAVQDSDLASLEPPWQLESIEGHLSRTARRSLIALETCSLAGKPQKIGGGVLPVMVARRVSDRHMADGGQIEGGLARRDGHTADLQSKWPWWNVRMIRQTCKTDEIYRR